MFISQKVKMDEKNESAKQGLHGAARKALNNIDYEGKKYLHNYMRVKVFQFGISNASNKSLVADIICKNTTSQILKGMVSQGKVSQ